MQKILYDFSFNVNLPFGLSETNEIKPATKKPMPIMFNKSSLTEKPNRNWRNPKGYIFEKSINAS